MKRTMRLMLAVSGLTLAVACAKKVDDAAEPAAPVEDVVVETAPDELPVVETAVDATVDTGPIGSANVTITMANGAPAFGAVGEGFCLTNGSCGSGINLNAAGNIDLSWFPPGDVVVTVALDQSMTAAGYSLPADPYQAVAIVVIPSGSVTAPIPVFGSANWPAEFDAPSITSAGVVFVDKEDDQQAYEYSIQLMRADGSPTIIDPKIENGGTGQR